MIPGNVIASLAGRCAIRYSMMGEALKKQTLLTCRRAKRAFGVDGSTPFDTADLVLRAFDAEPPHAIDKSGARNSETSGRSARSPQNPVSVAQHLQHVLALDLLESGDGRSLRFGVAQFCE